MLLNKQNNLLSQYCIIFYIIMFYKWTNGLLLYQLEPLFITTSQDFSTWLIMQTGLHKIFLNNHTACIIGDGLFLLLPMLLLWLHKLQNRAYSFIAYLMLIYNFVYIQILVLYPSYSIKVMTGWILFPCLFLTNNEKATAIIQQALRYMICYIMLSAALWKMAQGGIFWENQMRNILIRQHADILVLKTKNVWTYSYNWIIVHPILAQFVYLLAYLIELFFGVGFFTNRYDKILRYFLIIFLIADFFLMRIAYFDYLVFLLVLPLSKNNLMGSKFTFQSSI